MEFETLVNALPERLEAIGSLREILLANAVMFGEIPAPTFEEEARARFLCDRFNEAGLQSISVDEAGNALGVLPGSSGQSNILLAAHLDTPFAKSIDHAVSVQTDSMSGPAIGTNSLGVATLASLPALIEKLGIQFEDNLIFVGHTKSLGFGDLEGFRFFAQNNKLPIRAGVCTAGVQLGRLSYSSLGMLRGLVETEGPREYDWSRFTGGGAIAQMAHIVDGLLAIPLPQQPKTNILLGSIHGGTGFNTIATHATLGFEVRSEQVGMVEKVEQQIKDVVEQVRYESNTPVKLDLLARRNTGGIEYSHPLVQTARQIMESLEITPRIAPSTGALAIMIEHGIPAITLGITRGDKLNEVDETIQIEPVFKGLVQLISMIEAIDGGLCDVED